MSNRRRTQTFPASAMLAVLALGPAAGTVLQEPAPKTGDDKPADVGVAFPTDRRVKARLEAVADLIQGEDWATAATVLQGLFDRPQDVFIEVSRKGPDGKEVRQWTGARAEAERVSATLPPKGVELYRAKYGPEAADLLKQAREKKDPDLLEQVARRFHATDAAAEALQRLGMHHVEKGQPVLAAACFERLLRHPGGAALLTPEVLFKATASFRQSGDAASAEKTWKLLSDKLGRDGLRLGGRTLDAKELRVELDKIAPLKPAPLTDWPLFRGNATRDGQGVGGVPFLERKYFQPTMRAPDTRRFVEQAVKHRESRGDAILPAFFPIAARTVADGKSRHLVVFRSFWGIHVIDAANDGKLYWETPSHWSLDRMLLSNNQKTTAITQWINQYFQMSRHSALYENSTVGTLSTDGERVYVVEDLALPPLGFAAGGGAKPNLPFGQDVDQAIQHNRLQAYALKDGKFHWEAGGPAGQERAGDLAGSFFLGPPLPLGGKLYVLNEKDQTVQLVCLDAVKGTLHWTLGLLTVKEKLSQDPGRRIQGAHVSYGQGILVCPTNAGAVVGVDLLNRTLAWAYAYRERGPGLTPEEQELIRRGIVPRRAVPALATGANDWKASAPVVQDGKVVFTAPDGASIHCLNLRDGSLAWKANRSDKDVYLAGVYNDKVLIVGKESVRALSLSDGGKQLWTLPTGLPSGQGAASANVYYLPLKVAVQTKEPEVCAIDIDKGIVVAHGRSRRKEVPGNLLFFEGDVFSQTLSEISAYPQLKVKLEQVDQALAKNPKDAAGLLERGILKLDKGDLPGAVEDLRAALANNPPQELLSRAHDKLREALEEWLRRDFNAAEKYLKEYEVLLRIEIDPQAPAAEVKKQQAERTRRETVYLMLLAQGREQQGRLSEALDAYLRFGTLAPDADLVSVADEPAVKAAPEVWARGRIAAMAAKAAPEQRVRLEEAINEKWQQVKKANELDNLRRFVDMYGALFRAGPEARLLLAERLMEKADAGAFREAERHLLLVRSPNEENPPLAGRAVEALARLMMRKGLMEDAVHHYQILGRDYAKTVIRDGKTGADIFSDLATDKRFLPYLKEPGQVWQGGRIKVEEQRGVNQPAKQLFSFQPDGEPLPFFRQHGVALNLNFHQLTLIDRATRQENWSQRLTQTNFQNYIYAGQPQHQPRFPYHNVGHLVVLPLGHMVFGIDPVNKQLLWEKNLFGAAGVPPQSSVIPDPRDGTVQIVYQDGWVQRLGQIGPIQPSHVCLQTREGLTALDPVSGKTLWVRSDVTPRSHVFGDDRHLVVVDVNADGSAGGSRVLRAADGVAVPAADCGTLYQHRLRTVGSSLLLSETGPNGLTLRLYDVPAGKDLWKKTFPTGSIVLRAEEPDLVGAIDPQGKVAVVDLPTGKELLKAAIDPKHLDKPQAVHLLRDSLNWYVMIQLPNDPNVNPSGGPWSNLVPGSGIRALPVNGEVYAFRKDTGEVRWHNPVHQQMVVLEHFAEMPFLLFTSRYQKWGGAGGNRFPVQGSAVKSIDKQKGKLLSDQPEIVNGTQFYALNLDAGAGRIDLLGYNMKVTFTLVPGKVEEK